MNHHAVLRRHDKHKSDTAWWFSRGAIYRDTRLRNPARGTALRRSRTYTTTVTTRVLILSADVDAGAALAGQKVVVAVQVAGLPARAAILSDLQPLHHNARFVVLPCEAAVGRVNYERLAVQHVVTRNGLPPSASVIFVRLYFYSTRTA